MLLRKLAAREYEDLLQVGIFLTFISRDIGSMPVFEGLLPPTHDRYIQRQQHMSSRPRQARLGAISRTHSDIKPKQRKTIPLIPIGIHV
jgi:hypothetical protein